MRAEGASAHSVNKMIHKRKRARSGMKSGFYHFQNANKESMSGCGHGEYVQLRDEQGREWRGIADVMDDNLVSFRFRDSEGNYASGVSDRFGIILRDDKGNIWRGFVA